MKKEGMRVRLKELFESFRLRLFVTIIIAGVICITAMYITAMYVYRDETIESRKETIIGELDRLSVKIAGNMYTTTPQNAPGISDELGLLANMLPGRIIVADSGLKVVYDSYSIEVGKSLVSQEAVAAVRGLPDAIIDFDNEYMNLTRPIIDRNDSDTSPYIGVICADVSIKEQLLSAHKMETFLLFTALFLCLILAVIALLSSIEFAKPFKQIEESITHISDGYIDDKMTVGGYSEVRKLSDSFNKMLAKINTLEESRQEFVSNVSHELKTPITSIKVLAESLINQPDSPAEVYREFLHDINEEIDRENKIINDLLELVKLDRREGNMHIATVKINEMLEMIMKRLMPIASAAGVEMVYESYRDVSAMVDEVKMTLAFTNLIENSIKYNKEGGRVKVSLNSDRKYFNVTIADTGIGIPSDSIDKIFDRFYRVDKTRARESGGTGLGLAIARSVVLMHNGAIRVESVENEGTTFVVSVPLSFVV